MDPERALTARIYDAAVDRDRWQDFVEEWSRALDGAFVGFGLNHPSDPFAGTAYLVGITPEYRRTFGENLIRGLPFAAHFGRETSVRFVEGGELFPEIDLGASEFYREWMQPQGMAPVWFLGCSVWPADDGAGGWSYLWRRDGQGPFTPDDLALCDALLPHLTRAVRIHLRIASSEHHHRALGEVIDRLPVGVVLLDAKRQVVSTNRSADHILALDDGLRVGSRGPRASTPRDDEALERLVADAVPATSEAEPGPGGFTSVERPSGKRSFVVMVTPLLEAPAESTSPDAVAAVFVSDPEAEHVSATAVLEDLYELTPAEAELVRLLSSGFTLEQAAAKRDVTMNTARHQLKQIFAKTATSRQAELMRLVLTGVGTMRER